MKAGLTCWAAVLLGLWCVSNQQVIVPVTDPGNHTYAHAVKVFHYILGHWGESFHGIVPCGGIYCEWVLADHMKHLRNNLLYSTEHVMFNLPLTTMGVYNIHTVWEKARDTRPHVCELPTNLSMAETEESWVRYSPLFDQAVKHFDGFSSMHPARSNVQRVYKEAYLHENTLFVALNFSSLVKGGSYIASDCHRRDTANANRDKVVADIRALGMRVDGLGRCMHTPTGPEGISLPRSRDTRYNLHLKKEVIGKYMFHLAFENSIEDGYVTEKPFDALAAGTVPIYLGDSSALKALLPHPKSAIFISDFPSLADLVKHVNYLMENETAYEEYRQWRYTFRYDRNIADKPLMTDTWYCRLCQWAAHRMQNITSTPELLAKYNHTIQIHERNYTLHQRHGQCGHQNLPQQGAPAKKELLPASSEGKTLRFKNSKVIYIVRKGSLHSIPDMNTFSALKLDANQIEVVENEDKYIIGDPEPRIL